MFFAISLMSLLRYGRRQQGINQIGGGPVKDAVRHLLQRHPGADNGKTSGSILYREGPQRNARGILAVFLPFRSPAKKPVPDGVLRDFQGDRPGSAFQLVHDHIPVRRHGMAGQVPGRGNRDLSMPALVQIRGTDVRMVQHRPGIRERIDIVGHEDELPFAVE